ncbi:MAG TPA: FG-GAP-like repeat-containing protein [Myxococcota bacterium]|nr:FG-GAP-like repeat-containing protein [Myxococcota bacterium]
MCELVPDFTPSFAPELEWAWTGSAVLPTHNQVMMAPVVIDVNDDGYPDVVFNSFTGSNYNTNGVLRAIDGRNGADLWTVTDLAYRVRGASSIAAGDIDGDGLPEICTVRESGQVACFENDGAFKMALAGSSNSWGGPSLADLDGDGSVEIINANMVWSSSGALLWTGVDGAGGAAGTGAVSFAADIDGDGVQEVVNDRAIYRADGSLKCRNTALSHGLAGVGNFDADPYGEVVIVGSGVVALMDDDCATLWTASIPLGGYGGAPNIADFDGDGQAEVGVAGGSRYVVFETNGSILWSSPVQDFSSNRTGSATFDFEGDGSAEVVYGDERFLRIYDGLTGAIRFQVAHASGTTYENPLIVDVDADGNAEVVTCANNYAFSGPTGIRVWRDANDGWVNTRGIWNQHAYSITNVNEDGTIPAHPATNWLTAGMNNFRSNSQGTGTTTPFAAPDLAVSGVDGVCVPDTWLVHLSATVTNIGDAPASAGVNVAFYLGEPGLGGVLLQVLTIPGAIAVGDAIEVGFDMVAPGGSDQIVAVVDDDGSGVGGEAECDESNNAGGAIVGLACSPNEPPVADCASVVIRADAECLADGSVDNGSYDPDGDPITVTEDPSGPFGLGSTTVTLTVCDDGGLCDTCSADVTVYDDTPPTVDCGTGGSIVPSSVPVSYTATGFDACDVAVSVSGVTCTAVNGSGRVTNRDCVVNTSGATVTIQDTGGVGTTISWVASATDASGNGVSTVCSVAVTNPGRGSGCNQGLGNGAEGCDPGNSNNRNPTNDESGGTPGNGGRKNK